MEKYFCNNCKADSEMGAEFGEWSGVVVCYSCKTMGDKVEFVRPRYECDCPLRKAVRELEDQANENTTAIAILFDKVNRMGKTLVHLK